MCIISLYRNSVYIGGKATKTLESVLYFPNFINKHLNVFDIF